MKCPVCEKWNRAGLPHCIYCGAEFPTDTYSTSKPAWQDELRDREKPKSYIRVDESGFQEDNADPRDVLAQEMASLKERKRIGEEKQRQLRARSADRGMTPSGRTVRTTSNHGTFFSSYYDDPAQSLRPVESDPSDEEVRPGARRIYSSKYRSTYETEQAPVQNHATPSRVVGIHQPDESQPVYDGYRDTSQYIPTYHHTGAYDRLSGESHIHRKPRRSSMRRVMRTLMITLLICGLFLAGVFIIPNIISGKDDDDGVQATITPTIRNDLAAHTITIPGEENQRIMIRELHMTAIVTGGVATFDIPDHVWYDEFLDYTQDSMTVTVSPFVVSDSGKQTPLKQMTYEIDIPLSPIELATPDKPYKVVSTAMYTIEFYVREGSTLTINGEDYSDLVNTEGGKVSYNATVQPIGENHYNIVVRSQYCRENSMTVTLYREKQEVPLDLASDIGNTSSDKSRTMTVRATTIPGAVVKVLSPYVDLDITNVDLDGSFTFKAVFDKIGDNTIVITADYPNRKQTRVEHVVYYVPNADNYTTKAWDVVSQYTDLVDNIELRKAKPQIYVCKGKIESLETTKPQRAYMNVGTEESPLLVYVENSSKTTWEEGVTYDLYADAYGMYNSKPWLIVRYTYKKDEPR